MMILKLMFFQLTDSVAQNEERIDLGVFGGLSNNLLKERIDLGVFGCLSNNLLRSCRTKGLFPRVPL